MRKGCSNKPKLKHRLHMRKMLLLLCVLLAVIVIAFNNLFFLSFGRTSTAIIDEVAISDIFVENGTVTISGDLISSGSIFKGYHHEIVEGSLYIRIDRALPKTLEKNSGRFSLVIETGIPEIQSIYIADDVDKRLVWEAH